MFAKTFGNVKQRVLHVVYSLGQAVSWLTW